MNDALSTSKPAVTLGVGFAALSLLLFPYFTTKTTFEYGQPATAILLANGTDT